MENVIEEWKQIEGYENYSISNHGKVRSDKTNKIMAERLNSAGYKRVNVKINKKPITLMIHKLVATAFIPNLHEKECVDHINNIKIDNCINNLRWASFQENVFNSKLSKKSTSEVKGVHYEKKNKKWRARIEFNGKKMSLGYYINKDDAVKARVKKALEIQGEFINQCEMSELKRIEQKEESLKNAKQIYPLGCKQCIDKKDHLTKKEIKKLKEAFDFKEICSICKYKQ